ncbi:hypothetical protein J3R82DRAFT_5590 [Butyriboletus roseoflavus]|nr:hypothetical protein J3R82DRAFT_5590 [Butyriboletus roseoflavus]
MVHIDRVKVRPSKLYRPSPCKAEFVAMLGCWAATGDVLSADPVKCKEVADALFNCMRTTPVFPKPQRPSINYHLSKLQRKVK